MADRIRFHLVDAGRDARESTVFVATVARTVVKRAIELIWLS